MLSVERPRRLVADSHSAWKRFEGTDFPGEDVLFSTLFDLSRRRGEGRSTGALFEGEILCRDDLLPRKAGTMVKELSGERLGGPATEESLQQDMLAVVSCEAAPEDSLREDLREELPASE